MRWITYLLIIPSFLIASDERFKFDEHTQSWEVDDCMQLPRDSTPECAPASFFTLDSDYERVSSADLTGSDSRHVKYSELDIGVSCTSIYNCCEGLVLGVGWTRTELDGEGFEDVVDHTYDTVNFSISGFTRRLDNWTWKGGFSMKLDTDDMLDDMLLLYTVWGRYTYCTECFGEVGFNIGVLARTGMKDELVRPILGFDFYPRHDVKVSAVYPLNMSVEYLIDDCLSVELAGKIWNSRHRLPKRAGGGANSGGFAEYRNTGIETGVNYQIGEVFEVNGHIGRTLGCGRLITSPSNNHGRKKAKIGSSFYYGGNFVLHF